MIAKSQTFRALFLVLAAALWCGRTTLGREQNGARGKRPITVRDAIEMVRLGLPDALLNAPLKSGIAKFSPDGRQFVIVLKKGDLRKNTTDYSLLLYRTADAFRSPKPDTLVVLSTSSNREAIKTVKWLGDNSITFIGKREGAPPQVYEFNVNTRRLTKLTHHRSPVVAYDVSADGRALLFEADPTPDELLRNWESSGQGVVSTHDIINVLLGQCGIFRPTTTQGEELFLVRNGSRETRLQAPGVIYAGLLTPSLSPNGRYGLVGVFLREIPLGWSRYRVPWLRDAMRMPRGKEEAALTVAQYMTVNTITGQMQPLLNAPVSWQNVGLAWAPDSKSVAVSGTFLPLEKRMHPAENELRLSKSFVVEVYPRNNAFVEITDRALVVRRWDRTSDEIVLTGNYRGTASQQVRFQKIGTSWKLAPFTSVKRSKDARPEVTLQEDINTPPRIYVSSVATGKKSLLLDLNPQFSALRFGKVESITWKAADGHEVSGGLFFPAAYKPGERYPLVIQTHGFFPGKFYMDGPWSSAFAARPLASNGIFVLQVGYSTKQDDGQFENTPREGPRQMAVYEGAIDYLDKRGLIDRNRVGIIGFSRTVYAVAYTLTHSNYRFVAATLADGITGGYFDYLALPYLSNIPLLNGGLPFGESLAGWLKNAPNFRLDKVRTPVRIEAYGPASVLGLWGWFSGLTMLGKPVELIYLPGAQHLLNKPSDRLVSQQGNVDWFCFWLKNEENGKSQKQAEQYIRWNLLRRMEKKDE